MLPTHDEYYLDDRMVVLSCGGRLFRVPHWHLKKYCPVLLRPAEPGTDGTRGRTDDTAISVDDLVSVEEFVILLDFFYRGVLRKTIPISEWCKLLIISSKLACEEVRTRAIEELTANGSPIDRIELGNKYNVPQWLPEAYADVFIRDSHLTEEEGERLGLETAVKVLRGRDKCRRSGWNSCSSGDRRVAQLVEEIFPKPFTA